MRVCLRGVGAAAALCAFLMSPFTSPYHREHPEEKTLCSTPLPYTSISIVGHLFSFFLFAWAFISNLIFFVYVLVFTHAYCVLYSLSVCSGLGVWRPCAFWIPKFGKPRRRKIPSYLGGRSGCLPPPLPPPFPFPLLLVSFASWYPSLCSFFCCRGDAHSYGWRCGLNQSSSPTSVMILFVRFLVFFVGGARLFYTFSPCSSGSSRDNFNICFYLTFILCTLSL